MSKDWHRIGEVTLVSAYDKSRRTYDSLEHAVRGFNAKIINDLGDRPLGHYWKFDDRWGPGNWMGGEYYVFFDELGFRIPAWRVKEAYRNLPNVTVKRNRQLWSRKFRGGPSKRNERIVQEQRLTAGLDVDIEELVEYGVHLHARRHIAFRIDPWDDWPRSDWGSRSWKKHRRTQYKVVDKRLESE